LTAGSPGSADRDPAWLTTGRLALDDLYSSLSAGSRLQSASLPGSELPFERALPPDQIARLARRFAARPASMPYDDPLGDAGVSSRYAPSLSLRIALDDCP